MLAAVEDEDAVGGIGRDGRDLTELDLTRQLRPAGHRPVGRGGRRRFLVRQDRHDLSIFDAQSIVSHHPA